MAMGGDVVQGAVLSEYRLMTAGTVAIVSGFNLDTSTSRSAFFNRGK